VARFERKYIDANREHGVAFDDPKAAPYYDRYHGSIRRFVDEVRARHRAGVLLDVHAQVKMRDSLLRGTRNGRSVAKLTARAGFDAITGSRGLFGQLEANGFKVFPANSLTTTARHEDAGFNGGHTVELYGSGRPDGIDAVQLEFGAKYIASAQVEASAVQAARAIVAFYEAYLK
jgi:N-formylglutamate amidohydrolase